MVLDKDDPADDLKKMLVGRYKDYVNKYVFVYQYEKDKLKELVLEDILPQRLVLETYKETDELLGIGIDQARVGKLVQGGSSFIEYDDVVLDTLHINQKEEFKAKFKELLNNRINAILEKTNDKESFAKAFPEYEKWARGTIETIKSGTKGGKN